MHRDPDKGGMVQPVWEGDIGELNISVSEKKGNPLGGWKCCSVGKETVSCGTAGENECFGAVLRWRDSSCDSNSASQFAMWSLLESTTLCLHLKWPGPAL